MANTRIAEEFNSKFAVILRKLLANSPKTKEKTTYKMLAEHLKVKQQSVSSWANGTTSPEVKHIVPIADFFGVSCDHLLGKSTSTASDMDIRAISDKTGLDEYTISYMERVKVFIEKEHDDKRRFNPIEFVNMIFSFGIEKGSAESKLNDILGIITCLVELPYTMRGTPVEGREKESTFEKYQSWVFYVSRLQMKLLELADAMRTKRQIEQEQAAKIRKALDKYQREQGYEVSSSELAKKRNELELYDGYLDKYIEGEE